MATGNTVFPRSSATFSQCLSLEILARAFPEDHVLTASMLLPCPAQGHPPSCVCDECEIPPQGTELTAS